MGCWNETCMMTHLPIFYGEPAAVVLIAERPAPGSMVYADGTFAPVSLPILGNYDDYGRLEDIEYDDKALMLLAETPFISMEEHGNKPGKPIDLSGLQTESDWEDTIIGLIEKAGHNGLAIQFKNDLQPVYPAFFRRDFFDRAVSCMSPMLPIGFAKDVSYRVRSMENLRPALRSGRVTETDMHPLAALNEYLDAMRIPWHVTCGSGSQSGIDQDFQTEFYNELHAAAMQMHTRYDD